MKKAYSRKSKATGSNTKPKTVNEYLAQTAEPARSTLNKIRAAIRSAVPAEAAEIISYGIPAFKWKKIIVWYGAFSDRCSLFPTASVMDMFKAELAGYRVSKGTIHFTVDKPLPTALVKKMVKARVTQIEGKKQP